MYYTLQDIIDIQLQVGATNNISKLLSHLIAANETSEEMRAMNDGVNYYGNKPDISTRERTIYVGGRKKKWDGRSNHKTKHPFHTFGVDQKIDYILSNDITYKTETDQDAVIINQLIEPVKDKLQLKIIAVGRGASNKGKDWLHPRLNENGEFRLEIIDARECIPIYDERYQSELVEMVRYYKMTRIKDDGKPEDFYNVEWWNKEKVTYYHEVKKGTFVIDPTYNPNPRGHWIITQGEKTKLGGWGMVPFVIVRNNDSEMTDLEYIKSLIDDYDLGVADSSNDLADIQKLVWVLKNYAGQDYETFMKNLMEFMVINVEADGDAKTESADIPTEARESHLARLEKNIHFFGRFADTRIEDVGNSPSGIALKFLYSLLDLKARAFERNLTIAIKEVFQFIAIYLNTFKGKSITVPDMEIIYNHQMIFNESEKIADSNSSMGMISDYTRLSNHPYVKDPDAEMELIKAEEEAKPKIELNFNDDQDQNNDQDAQN